jgi:hypothetical protein
MRDARPAAFKIGRTSFMQPREPVVILLTLSDMDMRCATLRVMRDTIRGYMLPRFTYKPVSTSTEQDTNQHQVCLLCTVFVVV